MSGSLYDVAVFLHIAVALHLVGTTLLSPLIVHRVQSAGTRSELLAWLGLLQKATQLNPLSALILLVTGIYLGAAGWWSTGWFYLSIFAWVVDSVLAVGVIKRTAQKIAQSVLAEPEAAIGPELEQMRQSRGWVVAEKVVLGTDIAVLWLMIAKPETVESTAILTGVVALFAVFGMIAGKNKAA